MEHKKTCLPPQGIRTPSGQRGGVTVPGPSSSLSNDGLPEALSPSSSGEPAIGFSVLQALLDRADIANERNDDAAVIAAVEEFVRVIPRFVPPSDVSRSEMKATIGLWPTLLDFFANGMGVLEESGGLLLEVENLADQLDGHILELRRRPELPDPNRIRKFWDHMGPLRKLFTLRLRGGVSGGDGSAKSGGVSLATPSPPLRQWCHP